MNIFQKVQKSFLENRANRFYKIFEKDLNKDKKVLDFGCSWGSFSHVFMEKGYLIESIDIEDKLLYNDIILKIYNKHQIKHKNNYFDNALIVTVLHHTPNPEELLREVSRVSKRIILIEDIYKNKFQEFTTKFFDSLTNWEFKGHPHSNKTDEEWKKTFKNLNLKLINTHYFSAYCAFHLGIYILEKF